MRIIRQFSSTLDIRASIITIGMYDGFHLGHKIILRQIIRTAQEYQVPSVLITFHPHPKTVVRPDHSVQYLMTIEEKLIFLKNFGLDVLVILPFNDLLAQTSAQDFIQQVVDAVHPLEIWIGSDFQFGQGRSGTISSLKEMGQRLQFSVKTVDLQMTGDTKISSTQIRGILASGDVQQATQLLGHPFFLSGEVVEGDRRGRTIGFPTANISPPPDKLLPANGVYAVKMFIDDELYLGVANIGLRPTFDGHHQRLEVHLFDFNQDIYGRQVKVEFVAHLRPEQKFANVNDLITQIQQDVQEAHQILATND